MFKHIVTSAAISAAALEVSTGEGRAAVVGSSGISRVLLISIDGMHALDFINCATSSPVTCPTLAALKANGVNYLEASTSMPSDSFPGLTAIASGGSPRTEGAFDDVAYDRVLAPPIQAVSVGQKLIEKTLNPPLKGGYVTTPRARPRSRWPAQSSSSMRRSAK